ncbi:succinate dehydrogenase, cytochrome b556 subunit [Coxiella burnetii]|uniref:succinate dehydrogenase, cytochrome b556 subunit n=1 Tax=Coxiella burnetii TaxID=777 RepID=UPI000183D080|nr:succinate dehydrogenase, cytochrome b556 subunit [Coxiella burnetii]ACJ18019.1 succinate dehydrogenase cytochrome b556 subunit [Coxiella burnetii CbuG_Q212]OYK86605.1 succinate dehydrogenase, cytochrome b556 subunit [Coxiella burnetii]
MILLNLESCITECNAVIITTRLQRKYFRYLHVFIEKIRKGMNATRPVNLDLTKFHFPPMAILSIGHRISGFVLFLCMPLMFYLLHRATASAESFYHLHQLLLHNGWIKLAVWIMLSATLFHLFAGIRHLAMDLGFWESVPEGRISAYTVFVVSFIAIVLAGVWIW